MVREQTPVSGRRIVVMGLGRFGGGVGVTRWLVGQGARVCVTDVADAEALRDSVRQLDGLEVNLQLGGHDAAMLSACDLLVISPAVDRAQSDFVKEAIRRGIPCTSEMNLFLERCACRLVGVTGSVGKSTTTAMLGAALTCAARRPTSLEGRGIWIGGNIGRSLLDELPAMRPGDWAVLELSSFQLEDAAGLRRSPEIAVITNLRPNHLDRHGTMDAYAAAKLNVARFQSADDVLVIHRGERELLSRLDQMNARARRVYFGDAAVHERLRGVLRVPGRHNRENASAAWVVATELGVPDDVALAALAEFPGLPHRLEFVREFRGVRYYNDSKSTTPEATCTALEAFDDPTVLLAGGYDKGIPFDALARAAADRARGVVSFGATANKIQNEISQVAGSRVPPLATAADLPAALAIARQWAREGDVVVLSPGCASYDQFRNYEERGDLFRRIVNSWT